MFHNPFCSTRPSVQPTARARKREDGAAHAVLAALHPSPKRCAIAALQRHQGWVGMRRFGMTASGRPDAAHLLVWFVLITTAAHASPAPAPPQLIDEAVRLIPGAEAKRVTLPDTVPRPDASDGKIFEAAMNLAQLGTQR